MTNHGLTEEDAGDRDRWRNLVLGKENHCRVDKPLDDDNDDDDDDWKGHGRKRLWPNLR
jgi:hypothetical protein